MDKLPWYNVWLPPSGGSVSSNAVPPAFTFNHLPAVNVFGVSVSPVNVDDPLLPITGGVYVKTPVVLLYVTSPLPLAVGLGLVTERSVNAIPLAVVLFNFQEVPSHTQVFPPEHHVKLSFWF